MDSRQDAKIAKEEFRTVNQILLGALGDLARESLVYGPAPCHRRRLRNSRRVRGPYVANDGFGASA